MKERAGIQSVEVGFTLLDVLARGEGPLMLRDLAAAAGMSAAKAHRYLVSFQRLGLVQQDSTSTRYDLGPAALQVGLAALSRVDAVRMARERMPALMHDIGHTVALAVWGNQGPTIVHWQEAPQTLSSLRLGDVMPLLTSATGRCFAAFLPPARVNPRLKLELSSAQKMGRTDVPTTLQGARTMLDEVRAQGLSRVVDTLLPGVIGFCAPVFDADRHLVLGILAMGTRASLDDNWQGPVARALRQAAGQLSQDLGYRPAA